MASSLKKATMFRNVTSRRYYNCNTSQVKGGTSHDAKNTVLHNKAADAFADNEPTVWKDSTASVSRDCLSDQLSCIDQENRLSPSCNTKNTAQLAVVRNKQETGVAMKILSTRKTILYTIQKTKSTIEQALPFLTSILIDFIVIAMYSIIILK